MLAAALAAALASPRSARAYRPFDGTDASVAERGDVEIELGPAELVRGGGETSLAAPRLVLNWGFADALELVLEGRHLVRLGAAANGAPRAEVDDAALSVKGVLREGALQDRPGPSVAAEVAALLPGTSGPSGAGAQVALIGSLRWPDVTLHVNGAAAWTREHRPGASAGVIVEGHDAWSVRPVAELTVDVERDVPATAAALAGAIWRVSEALSLDAALRVARGGGATETQVRVGLTWAFAAGFPQPRRKP
jgi:hypothetical protein